MAWPTNPRPAKSLLVLRDQIDARWPGRDKSSDGMLGDARHAATKSDHNPNAVGVVTAIDITNDPAHGFVSRKLAEDLLASRDPRIKYVISNGQICSSLVSPWVWRPYSGANAHEAHCHISVMDDPALYDDTRPWKLDAVKPSPGRITNIKATEFGGTRDPEQSAYDGHLITDAEFGVSLPAGFTGHRPQVRVWRGNRSVVCQIVDKGPWNINDPYWQTGTRPQAETGTDLTGRPTNRAGIDLTPAVMDALGVPGPAGTRSTVVDWEFVSQPAPVPTPKPPVAPAAPKEPTMDLFKFLPLLMRILQIIPQIQTAAKAGTNIFTLLQQFAPDLLSILTGVGSTLFPELPKDSQTKVGAIMMDPVKVQWIQNAINTLGLANPPLIVDGSYGQLTKAAVTAFQTAHNVTPADGWAGDITEAALRTELNKKAAAAPAAGPVVSLAVPVGA